MLFPGVNLEEEAVNLLRYEHAFQANAQLVQVSSEIFDILLNMLR